ncbi:hypothetical protein ACFCWB_21730 [Streptomyces bacillaris]|uniref:hypothetical protein n=1 Tax=Streptomyces bacillaris TaxID=68179 RepID=UPI0035D73C02
MAISTHLSLRPALNLWGYGPDSCPDAPRLADWEEARLAVEAGSWLGLHTRRPPASPEPPGPAEPGEHMRRGPLVNGWLSTYSGWRPIVREAGLPGGPAAVDAQAVADRLTATSHAGLRVLVEGIVRKQHYPDDLPHGVALFLACPLLPDQWRPFMRDGWVAALTRHRPLATGRLPKVPNTYSRRDLRKVMEWLERQPGLDDVRDAFTGTGPQPPREAAYCLRYEDHGVADRPERVALARLLHLYEWALHHRDQPLIDLVADIRQPSGTRR